MAPMEDQQHSQQPSGLVNGTSVAAGSHKAVISTAKVVPSVFQSRSEDSSPTSESAATTSEVNPDSGYADVSSSASASSKLHQSHTSPKPERRQISPEKEDTRRESRIKKCPPHAYKFFMEQHIENVIKAYEQRRQRQFTLEKELVQFQVNEPNTCEQMRLMLQKKETNYLRMKRAKLNKKHFKKIKKIGTGAFGEVSSTVLFSVRRALKSLFYIQVFLVRSLNCGNGSKASGLYAMKTLKKSHVVEKNQVAHVIAEKDILAEADNHWIVKLYYSFQVGVMRLNRIQEK